MLRTRDLVCFSHLRWNFVFQRPNHLMCRAAREYRVFFVEEPYFDAAQSHSVMREVEPNLFVVTPWLRRDLGPDQVAVEQRRILAECMVKARVDRPVLWFYTPMALAFAGRAVASNAIVPLRASGRNEPFVFALAAPGWRTLVALDPLSRVSIAGPSPDTP